MATGIISSAAIGAIIKQRRRELGLSQEQLAEQVGVSYQQVQRYENGISMLTVENVQRIAGILALPVASLFNSEPSALVADPQPEYTSAPEETALLKQFRMITDAKDKQLILTLAKRLAKNSSSLP